MKLHSKLVVLSTFVLLVSTSSVAFAQSDAQETPPATSEMTNENSTQEDKSERKPPRQATNNVGLQNGTDVICKKSTKKGTRLRAKKICKTRAEWDRQRLETKQGLDEIKAQTRVGQAR